MTQHTDETAQASDSARVISDSYDDHRDTEPILYRLGDSIIIRDERHLLNSGWYLVASPSVLKSWHFGADAFGVIEYLRDPRSSADIEQYRATLPATSRLGAPERMSEFITSLQQMGIVESIAEDFGPARPVCLAATLPPSTYAPASAPISMVVELPMAPDMFRRLMAEADALGVLGVDFRGGSAALQFLAEESSALQYMRAAVAVWVSAHDVTESEGEMLSSISAALGRHPFIIVETRTALAPDDPAVQVLKSLGVPFCLTHHVLPSAGPPQLRQMAANALAAGVAFSHFLLDAGSFGADESTTPTAVAEKLAVLGEIQWVHKPMQVQVRAPYLPLPYYITVPAPTLGQLFSSYLGGCSAGLIALPMPVHVRPIWTGDRSDETPPNAGPRLPTNCCQAGMTHLAVGTEGMIYPCEEALGICDLVMGDLRRDPLADIWRREQWAFLRGGPDLHGLSVCRGSHAHMKRACRRGWARANTRCDVSIRLGGV